MKRRDFLKTACATTGAGVVGRMSGRAAGAAESGAEMGDRPAAVEPLADYLKGFRPAMGPAGGGDEYTLEYDVVRWQGRRNGTVKNPVIGHLKMSRGRQDGDIRIRAERTVKHRGIRDRVQADITCGDAGAMQTWTCTWRSGQQKGDYIPALASTERGRRRDGRIEVAGDGYDYELKCRRPLMCQWTVPDLLMRADVRDELPMRLDMLRDLSGFSPGQRLQYDGAVDVPVKGGKTVRMQSYLRSGPGAMPVHYLLDDEDRPQLVSACMLSWALTSIS